MDYTEAIRLALAGERFSYPYYEAAISLIEKNAEFREIYEYYRTRKNNPLKKMQSVVAIACKVIRVFYAVLTKGVDYDPQKLMSDIHRLQMQEGWRHEEQNGKTSAERCRDRNHEKVSNT